MARRPNYGGEKRQKEILRQKKKEEKAEKKRARKESAGADGPSPDEEAFDPSEADGADVESDPHGTGS